MTDKEKIREYLVGMAGAACCDAKTKKNIETNILPFIDSLQEEPQVKKLAGNQHEDKTCKENGNSLTQEPVSESIDFEQELYKAFGQIKDFTLGIAIAKRFYDMGRKHNEPVSEDLEAAAKNHSVERYRTTRDRELAEKCKWSFKAGAKWQLRKTRYEKDENNKK